MRHPLIVLGLTLVLAACSGPQATTAPPPITNPTQQIDQIFVPDVTFTPVPTVAPGQAPPTVSFNADPEYASLPYSPSPEEIAAVESGTAQYSGFLCLATPAGCACDQPVILAARFSFTQDGQMVYRYRGGPVDSQVVMNRIGVNQWDYTLPIVTDDTEQQEGAVKALISFNNRGYTYTQVTEFLATISEEEDGYIRCPDVVFRRLDEPVTPTPEE